MKKKLISVIAACGLVLTVFGVSAPRANAAVSTCSVKLIVFQNAGFAGNSLTYCGAMLSNLYGGAWDKTISSIQSKSINTQTAWDAAFNGNFFTIKPNSSYSNLLIYSRGFLVTWNDAIRTVSVM